jgi:hypothetical protein
MVCTVATPAGGSSSFGKQQHKGKPDNLPLRSQNFPIFIYDNRLNLRRFGSSWRGQSYHLFPYLSPLNLVQIYVALQGPVELKRCSETSPNF